MGACCSSGAQSGDKKPEDTDRPSATAKGEKKASEAVTITVEQVNESSKEPAEEPKTVKQSEEVAEEGRKDTKAEVEADDLDAKEAADASSEPVTTAGSEGAANDKGGAPVEDEAAVASSEVESEEVKASQEEPIENANITSEAEIQLPGAVESAAKENPLKSASPDDVSLSPEKAEKGHKANAPDESVAPQSEDTEEVASADPESEKHGAIPSSTGDVVADSETVKQAASIAKAFVTPLEEAVIANVTDKKSNEASSEVVKESLERGEVTA